MSGDQVIQWLKRIGFPGTIEVDEFPATLENLELLSRLHLVAFPFENLDMHYSPQHTMDVSPDHVFRTLVLGKEHRGSYCYGKSGLFLEMIRGLGYRAYAGQGRVNGATTASSPPEYTPLVPHGLFVQPFPENNTTYLVDVGFGGGGLVRPILLSDAEDNFVFGGTSTERHRLSKGEHPNSVVENPFVQSWLLQVQHTKPQSSDSPAPWRTLYTFTETEFFPPDFESASHFVSTHPNGSPFLREVICMKYFFMDDNKDGDMGYTTLYRDTLRRHIGATTQDVMKMKTEKERIEAINSVFGIVLDQGVSVNVVGQWKKIGSVDCYVATPTTDYPQGTALLYLANVFGPELTQAQLHVDSFAENGFRTIAPDYFNGDPVPADAFDGGNFDITKWYPKYTREETRPALDNVISALKEDGVKTFGATGYCFGGRYIFDLASENIIKVAATSHPSFLQVPADFEKYVKTSQAPLLINSCTEDEYFPPEAQAKADEVFKDFEYGYERIHFDGCEHGFAVRGDMNDPKAKAGKEGAFRTTVEWLRRYL
ncbi:hypothetical protein VNI00_014553 [Paramarasmius palmivorus]|uniref:Dienelactone hydrolase domain-containing protein n=1 Tax=Paramarasmius palmivorus TaxID=297713 RepID=A0AAW0BRK7_9AGAR